MYESESDNFVEIEDVKSYFDQLSSDDDEETPKHARLFKTNPIHSSEEDESNGKVMYTTAMRTGPKQYKTIDYDQIDEFDFKNVPFIEVVQKPSYVHFYIDSDNIETREEYDEFYTWLESLKPYFGKFVIGGYTNNKDLFGDLYKYQPEGNHTLSLHVVFYETKIKSDLLVKIMKHKQTRGKDGKVGEGSFVYNVNRFVDPNVYKLDAEQKMRHVLSDKFYRKDDKNNSKTKGSFLDQSFKPHQFMMAIRGGEKEISY